MTATRRAPSPLLVPTLILIGAVTSVVSSLGSPLLPTIARVDHVSLGNAQWSLTITMLVGAVTAPVLGRLGDGRARRLVIFSTLGVVLVGSVLAALPSGFVMLLVGRGLQGAGLGLMPLTMAVARDNLPAERSAPTIAILSIVTAAGVGLGYPITGLIDDAWGLHAPFWFGVIMSAAALLISLPIVPRSDHLERRPLDSVGAGLLVAGLVALLLGATEGQPWGWGSVRVLGLLAGGVILIALWVVWEGRTKFPLVELRLVRHASVAVTNGGAMLMGAAMYMYFPLITDYVQTPKSAGYGFGVSVVVSGLMLVPFSILSTSMSRVAAWLGTKIGQEMVVPIGFVVMIGAVAIMAAGGNALWEAFLSLAICGIGVGFTFAAMPGIIVRAVPGHETGSALGFYQVVRYVGFAIGSAVTTSVLAAFTPAGSMQPGKRGFTVALLVSAGICLVAAVMTGLLGRPSRPETPDQIVSAEREVAETVPEADVIFE